MRLGLVLFRDLVVGVAWIAGLNVVFFLPLLLGHGSPLPALAHDPAAAALVAIASVALLVGFAAIHLRRSRQVAPLRLRPIGAPWPWIVGAIVVLCLADALGVVLYQQVMPLPPASYEWLYGFVDGPYGWLPLVLAVAVVGPFIEEVIFRGWIQRRLERRFTPAVAIAGSSLLFAAAHMIPALIPYYFIMGVILGYAVYRSRSLWAGIILHMAMNAYTLGFVFLGPAPERVEAWAPEPPVLLMLLAVFAVLAAALVYALRRLRGPAPAPAPHERHE